MGADDHTKVAFKNCAQFRKFKTEINETLIDEAEHVKIGMPTYNLIECSDCSDAVILILQEVYGSLKEIK